MKNARIKLTNISTISVPLGVLPNFVSIDNARRLPRFVSLMAEVNTNAATINQIISYPKAPNVTFCFSTAPIIGKIKIPIIEVW